MNPAIVRETFVSTTRHPMYLVVLLVLCAVAVYLPLTGETEEVHVIGLADMAGFVMAATLIGPEWHGTVLQLILIRPVRRADYVVSRYLGGLLATWMLYVIPSALQNPIAAWRHLPRNGSAVWISFGNHFSDSALMIALMVFLGCFARSYEHVIYYWVIRIAVNLLTTLDQFPNAPMSFRSIAAVLDRNLFPTFSYTHFQHGVVLTALSNAALCLLAACWVSTRRDLTYAGE